MTMEEMKRRVEFLWTEVDDAAREGNMKHALECASEAEHLEFVLEVKELAIGRILSIGGRSGHAVGNLRAA